MPPIQVLRTNEAQAVRIALSGELDIASVDEVERQVLEAMDDPPRFS